jgi:hypothetical protein
VKILEWNATFQRVAIDALRRALLLDSDNYQGDMHDTDWNCSHANVVLEHNFKCLLVPKLA